MTQTYLREGFENYVFNPAVTRAVLELCAKDPAGSEVDPLSFIILLGKDNVHFVLVLVDRILVAFISFDVDTHNPFLAVGNLARVRNVARDTNRVDDY